MQVEYRQKSRFWSNSWLSKIAGRANYEVTKTVTDDHQCIAQSATHQRMFVCDGLQHGPINTPKRTEKNLIVRSGISEAETTNNKRLRSTFCIEAIQTRSIARPLCDSRASCMVKGSVRGQCHQAL